MIGAAVIELEEVMATSTACEVLGRSRATHYRRRQPKPDPLDGGVVERRRQATHPPRSRPELVAEAPDDGWP